MNQRLKSTNLIGHIEEMGSLKFLNLYYKVLQLDIIKEYR